MMQPYQKIEDELLRQQEKSKGLLKTGLNLASTYAGATLLSKATPFLSQFIPEELAIKGLSKLNPNLGKFVNSAMKDGFSFDMVKDFLGNEIQREKAKNENRNPIERYSSNLYRFMKERIMAGMGPKEAATEAKLFGKFNKEINQMIKDYKTTWPEIAEIAFVNMMPQQVQNVQAKMPQETMASQPTQQQEGPGQQALMAILQKIQAQRAQGG